MSILVTQLIARVIADTTQFNAGMAQARATSKGMEASTAASAGRTVKTQERMSTASKVFLGAAAIGVYKAAASFADFDKQMHITERVTGATTDQMVRMREQAVKLGADVKLPGVSASDVAIGMQELGRAGFSADQVMKSIHGSMLLGTAGQIEYADAAKITAQAINAFGLEHEKAGHVADLLAATANASQSEVGDVADAFRYSATQAQQAGVGIEDLTLLIAQLSNKGIEASVAGTSLRAMFTRLVPQTEKQAGAWEALGLLTEEGTSRFFDAKGAFVGVSAAADIYRQAMAGLSEEERIRMGHQAFGVLAQRGFNNTLGLGSKALDDLHSKFNTNGAALRVAEANTKGLNGAVQSFRNLVETLGITLGESMAPTLIIVFNTLNKLLGPLAANKTAMQIVVGLLLLLTAHLIIVRVQIIATSVANGILAKSFWKLTAAILANPIGWLALAIIGIILILRHFGVSVDDVWRAFDRVMGAIKRAAQSVLDFFKNNWKDIVLWVVFPFPMLIQAIIRNWDRIKGLIVSKAKAAVDRVRTEFGYIVGWLRDLAPRAYNAAKNIGSQIANGIIDGMAGLGERMSEKINPLHSPGKWLGGKIYDATRASGGPVTAGRPYMVGERGAELFVPRHSGSIVPNNKLGGGMQAEKLVHIENYNANDATDVQMLASILGRKLATR